MAKKPSGKRRADVKVSVLDQLELRGRKSATAKLVAKRTRAEIKAAKSAERIARMLEVEKSLEAGKVKSFNSTIVTGLSKHHFRRNLISGITFSVAAGLFATFALPAYAFSPEITALAGLNSADAQAIANGKDTQGLTVVQVQSNLVTSRGTYQTVKAASLRVKTLKRYRSWNGMTAEAYLQNPPFSSLTGAQVVKVASKYIGVPYVFGGSTPGGFDCSGLTRYVFSQFGVSLAHSVSAQGRKGHRIKASNAQPGDLVVWNDGGHIGIYVGGGNMIHAPSPGDTVKLAPIFSSAVHFVRISK